MPNVVAVLFSGGWLAKRFSSGRGRGVSNVGISEGDLTFAPGYVHVKFCAPTTEQPFFKPKNPKIATKNRRVSITVFHQGNVLKLCRWDSNSAVGDHSSPHCCGAVYKLHMLGLISRLTMVLFKQPVTCHFFCLLPRLQDVEDREKENQAGFFLSKGCPAKTLTKDLKVQIEGTGNVMIWYNRIEDQRQSESQQRVFWCMRSVMRSEFAGTRGWRKGRTDLTLQL